MVIASTKRRGGWILARLMFSHWSFQVAAVIFKYIDTLAAVGGSAVMSYIFYHERRALIPDHRSTPLSEGVRVA